MFDFIQRVAGYDKESQKAAEEMMRREAEEEKRKEEEAAAAAQRKIDEDAADFERRTKELEEYIFEQIRDKGEKEATRRKMTKNKEGNWEMPEEEEYGPMSGPSPFHLEDLRRKY